MHRNIGNTQCLFYNTAFLIALSVFYAFVQLHFLQMIYQTWKKFVNYNDGVNVSEDQNNSATKALKLKSEQKDSGKKKLNLAELEMHNFQEQLSDITDRSDEDNDEIRIQIPQKLRQHIKAIKFEKKKQEQISDFIDNRLALYGDDLD